MDCHGNGNKNEEGSEGPVTRDEHSTIQQCHPEGSDRNHLYSQRDGLVLHKVGNIWSELGMIHQPVIKFPVAAKKKGSGAKVCVSINK